MTDLQTATESDLDAYLALGVTHMILPLSGPDWDLDTLRRLLAWRDSRS